MSPGVDDWMMRQAAWDRFLWYEFSRERGVWNGECADNRQGDQRALWRSLEFGAECDVECEVVEWPGSGRSGLAKQRG